jgi:hypothetical protein
MKKISQNLLANSFLAKILFNKEIKISKVINLTFVIIIINLLSVIDAKSMVEKKFLHRSERLTKKELHLKHNNLHLNRFNNKPNKSYLNDKDSDTVINLFYDLDVDDLESRVEYNIEEHRKYIDYLIKRSKNKIYTNESYVYDEIGKEILS